MRQERGRWIEAALIVCAVAIAAVQAEEGKDDGGIPTIAERTEGMECQDGLLRLCWDPSEGKLFLEVVPDGGQLLYAASLASGVGANLLGLDRGSTRSALVHFERVGRRVLLVQENTRFRASAGDDALREGVERQFTTSVLGGWMPEAEEGDRVLVDATEFFVRDALGVARGLRGGDQGDFEVDADRSAVSLPRTRSYPRNTEVEALLTLTSSNPGDLVQSIMPDGSSLTVQVHQSFVALPDPYLSRRFDPRVGVFPITYQDYSQPLDSRLEQRRITRWRLEKADPAAEVSPPVQPIVYYLDPAMPEPVRSAIREGALWWNEMFEAAGFRGALEVRDPEPHPFQSYCDIGESGKNGYSEEPWSCRNVSIIRRNLKMLGSAGRPFP